MIFTGKERFFEALKTFVLGLPEIVIVFVGILAVSITWRIVVLVVIIPVVVSIASQLKDIVSGGTMISVRSIMDLTITNPRNEMGCPRSFSHGGML